MAGLGKLVKQAQKMQKGIEALQAQLEAKELDITAGGGAVKIKVNGAGKFLALTLDPEFLKEDPKLVSDTILTAVQDLEHQGYEFESAEASFDLLVRKVAKDHKPWEVGKALTLYKPWFERVTYRVNIEARENGTPVTEATVRLKVAGQIEHTASEGDGPVNALDNALRKALAKFYPSIENVRLVDYKVRVLDDKHGTEGLVRVLVESSDHIDHWTTVGVSPNVLEASWQALVDSIDYKLYKDQKERRAQQPSPVISAARTG